MCEIATTTIQEIVATAPKHPSNHPWLEQENVFKYNNTP